MLRWMYSTVNLMIVYQMCTGINLNNTSNRTYVDQNTEDNDYFDNFNRYARATEAIAKHGQWQTAIFVTDDITSVLLDMSLPTIVRSSVSCEHALGTNIVVSKQTDYVNIVVQCNDNITAEIITQFYNMQRYGSDGLSFNWLLLGSSLMDDPGASEDSTTQWTQRAREGDNMAVITTQGRSPDLVDVMWCLTDCHMHDRVVRRWYNITIAQLSAMDTPLLPANFVQFYGRNLRITYAGYKPFFYDAVTNGHTYPKGIDLEIVDVLATEFNFSYTLVQAIDGTWGTDIGNGSWNGMIGMVYRKEVEMAISGITMTSYRDQVIDYLYPNWEASSAVVLRLPHFKWLYFVKVFHPQTWLTILLCPLAIAIILVAMDLVHQCLMGTTKIPPQSHADDRFHSNVKAEPVQANNSDQYYARVLGNSFGSTLLYLYGGLFSQGDVPMPKPQSGRVVYVSFYVLVVLLVALYAGNLTATLAVSDVRMPFDTLDELAKSNNYIFQVRVGAFREQIFRESSGGVYKRLWAKIEREADQSLITDQELAYSRVLQGGYTYTASKIRLDELVKTKGRPDLVIMKETYFKTGKALVVQSGVPYRRCFHNIVLRLMQSGIVHEWTRRHETKDRRNRNSKMAPIAALTVSDVSLVFMAILGVGIGVATTALLIENTISHLVNKV